IPNTESIILSERFKEMRLCRTDSPEGTETRRLDDKSRCVSDVRYGNGSVGRKVKALSDSDRCFKKAHLSDESWVERGGDDASSWVGAVSSALSITDSGSGVPTYIAWFIPRGINLRLALLVLPSLLA